MNTIYVTSKGMKIKTGHVYCHDGFMISVQASSFHYCQPRINNAEYYREFELGYPSESDPDLMEYIEGIEPPTQSVYPYVPHTILFSVIQKHGGIKHIETRKN